MTKLRSVSVLVVLLAVSLAAAPARADDAIELERAKTSYDAGRYAEGVERFREILNPASSNALHEPAAIERARAYYAACLIALGRSEEGDAEIEKLIRNNPVYSPDPVAFPSKVIDRFIDVKARLKDEIEATFRARSLAEHTAQVKTEREQRAYLETLRRLASQETILVRHSRWMAMVPFGAGQFQNGQEGLGYTFLLLESALAATSIAANVVEMKLIADSSTSPGPVDYVKLKSQIDSAYDVNLYSTGALALVALTGIVHAQITFVSEVEETRIRPLPQPPSLAPKVGVGPAGFVFGLGGRF